ncbi:unnamed protein product [Moneuplotes crassus]|uniref:Uncharacterized protein n=1 Tax=Euplotes crassus TaxID=5936 RepID=A0AAD1X611_EUPCR|nr:unnamed protein product [Moneuplotes crassus]
MNSEKSSKPVSAIQDIWDDERQIIEDDDCSPQLPKMTKQFSNTLKNNKGKANKDDFKPVIWNTSPEGYAFEPIHHVHIAQGTKNDEIRIKYRQRCNRTKPRTYDLSLSQKWACCTIGKKANKSLRRIPSSDILRNLLT